MADEPDLEAGATLQKNEVVVEKPTLNEPSIISCVKAFSAYALATEINIGRDVNVQDKHGMTALHHAAATGARPCIRLLVNSGKCDYLIQDKKGRYASDLAIQWARDHAVGRLLTKHQLKQAHERGVPAWVPSDPL